VAPPPPPPPYVLTEATGAAHAVSTEAVARVVRGLAHALGISLRRAYRVVAGPFPVAGAAHWSDEWHAPRPCPWPHVHLGLDILAAEGTPVVAVANGRISAIIDDDVTGLGIKLSAPHDRMQYLYAHLSRFTSRAVEGRAVRRGQGIGF